MTDTARPRRALIGTSAALIVAELYDVKIDHISVGGTNVSLDAALIPTALGLSSMYLAADYIINTRLESLSAIPYRAHEEKVVAWVQSRYKAKITGLLKHYDAHERQLERRIKQGYVKSTIFQYYSIKECHTLRECEKKIKPALGSGPQNLQNLPDMETGQCGTSEEIKSIHAHIWNKVRWIFMLAKIWHRSEQIFRTVVIFPFHYLLPIVLFVLAMCTWYSTDARELVRAAVDAITPQQPPSTP